MDRLHTRAVPVHVTHTLRPLRVPYGVVDYKMAKTALFAFLSAPYERKNGGFDAVRLAGALRDLERGDGVALWGLVSGEVERVECGEEERSFRGAPDEAQRAVLCGDGERVGDRVEDLQAQFEGMRESSEFADVFMVRGGCM